MPQTPSPSSGRPRVPLAVQLDSRQGDATTDARIINGFVERDADGDWQVNKRPGVSVYVQNVSPIGHAVGQFLGFEGTFGHILSFYFDSLTVNTKIFESGVLKGTFSGTDIRTTSSQYADDFIVVNGGGTVLHTYQLSTSTVVAQAVPTGSTLVPGIVTLDDTTYVMDQLAQIWGSGIGNAVFGGNFSQARSEPGYGVYLTKQGPYVVAMKTFSTEFFYDAVNPTGNPISPAKGLEIKWGCSDARTVQDIDDTLIWLARSRESTPFIAMMIKQQSQRISPPWVDRMLQENVFNSVPIFSSTFKTRGHSFYVLTVASVTPGGLTISVVYDITQQQWYLWQGTSSPYWPFVYAITHPSGVIVVEHATDNTQTFAINPFIYTDRDSSNDLVFSVDIYTPNADFGTRRVKTLSRMDFIGDQQPCRMKVRFSEDDQRTWSQFRELDLNLKRPTLIDCGTFRRRAWNFRHEAATPFRLNAVELDLGVGS